MEQVIPKQLSEFKFILIKPSSKIPFEKNWQHDANYEAKEEKLLKHVKEGGNYGVLCGVKGLCVIDSDKKELQEQIEAMVPETFTVKTGRGGKHFYFLCPNLEKPIRLTSGSAQGDVGDVQWQGKQVIGPGSTHPNGNKYEIDKDIPIATVSAEQIKLAVKNWVKEEPEQQEKHLEDNSIDISKVAPLSNMRKQGQEYYGKHPVHGSDGGMNFWVNPSKGTWHCFRCDSGGGAMSLIAVLEGIIPCHEAVKGGLKGEKFKQVLQIAQEKHGLALPKEQVEKRIQEAQNDELIINEGVVDFKEFRKALEGTHSHLRLFEQIEKTLGLNGKKYYPVKKFLCYFSESVIQPPIQTKIGTTHSDNRIHGLIIATAGKGKGVIKNNIKHSFKGNHKVVIETSGLVHPEQLIGKMVKKGRGENKELIPNKGYLGADVLLHDEANTTLNEKAPNADQSQRIKRTAMDAFGQNLISKKLVDDTLGELLEYNPTTRCLDFMHPEQFEPCFFDKGTYRRYFCFELGNSSNLSIEESVKSIFEEPVDYSEQKRLFESMCSNSYSRFNLFVMNDECKNIVRKWILLWQDFVLNHQNSVVRRFGEMTFYSIKEYFFKMVTVLHGANLKEASEADITQMACIDCVHFLLETLENYCKYGNMANTTDVWRGAKDMEIKALEYLWRNAAVSYDSSEISIVRFKEVVSELFGVHERQARGIISSMKSKNFISSKQVGSDSSRVWLNFEPSISKVDCSGVDFGVLTKPEGGRGGNGLSTLGCLQEPKLLKCLKMALIHASTLQNKNKNIYKEGFIEDSKDISGFVSQKKESDFGAKTSVSETLPPLPPSKGVPPAPKKCHVCGGAARLQAGDGFWYCSHCYPYGVGVEA